jgi:ferredoxin
MRVEVDYDECEANAVCAGIAPEYFRVDDEDNLHLLQTGEIPKEDEERVRRAVNGCPKRALRVVE